MLELAAAAASSSISAAVSFIAVVIWSPNLGVMSVRPFRLTCAQIWLSGAALRGSVGGRHHRVGEFIGSGEECVDIGGELVLPAVDRYVAWSWVICRW